MLAWTHLPELRRDEITRALSELRMPEIDLRETVSKLDVPRIDLELPDVRKAMADAGDALRIGQRAERPRWLLAAGGLAIAAAAGAVITGLVLVRDRAVREPLARAWGEFREGVSYATGSLIRRLRGERTELIALEVAPEAPAPAMSAMPADDQPATGQPVAGSIEEPVLVESGDPC